MATFSLFWTAVALLLTQAPFHLSQRHVALFALAGAAGAIAAPLAGRMGDRGWTRPASTVAHLSMLAAMLLAGVAGANWGGLMAAAAHPTLAIGLLVLVAIGLDAGLTTDQTLGRRAINLLPAQERGRLNGLFVGIFFVGGAVGAANTLKIVGIDAFRAGFVAPDLLGVPAAGQGSDVLADDALFLSPAAMAWLHQGRRQRAAARRQQ